MWCIPSRHQYNEEAGSEECQGWPRCKEWSKYWSSRNWAYGKYVSKTKMEWALMCIVKTSSWWKMKKWAQDQDEPSRRDRMLEDCHPHDVHGYVKTFPKDWFSHRSMGEQLSSLHQASAIKKGVPSWGEQDHHHQAQVEYTQGKGMILIGFALYRSRSVNGETGL